jgi:2-polyprenyl-6-methoxyphenol hydroxylase-like FAD-dependent oxidoreductase
MEEYDAVIVGGGIGGLALGYKLARNGHNVCVLEAKPEVVPSKRGVTLQPNGLAALQNLGLLDEVAKIGEKRRYVAWYEIGGELLARLDWAILDHPHNYLLTVIPSELELLLRKEFLREGGVLHESTFFLDVASRNGDRVGVSAKRAGNPAAYSARVLVGADGENSRVRSALKIPARVKEYSDHFLFMRVEAAKVLEDEARQYYARGKMVGFFPTHSSTYVFYYIRKGRFERLKSRGLDSFKRELSRIEPGVKDSLGSLNSWDDVVYTATKRVDVESWTADRVALLGDAVHALNPSLAQGLNMTLQDVVSLGKTLEACFESGDFDSNRLGAYESSRRKPTKSMQQQAERVALIVDTESRFYTWLAKRMFRKIGEDSDLMKRTVGTASGLTDNISVMEMLRLLI